MPVNTQLVATVTPQLPPPLLAEMQNILCSVAAGAYGRDANFKISAVTPANQNHTALHLEVQPDTPQGITADLAMQLAETTLQMIAELAKGLGVPTRISSTPSRRMMILPGLTWPHARCRFRKILAALESLGAIELACASSSFRLRVTTRRPPGSPANRQLVLCDAVISRRMTPRGSVVRIRSGRAEMSIIVPAEIGADAISDGMVLIVAPVVGMIPLRLVAIAPCQFSLFGAA